MAKDLKEFLTRMKEDSAFAEEVKAKGKSIAEAENISDDKELTIRVGKELGYEFTMGDIERSIADNQELDDKELKKAAGGGITFDGDTFWCWDGPWSCIVATNNI